MTGKIEIELGGSKRILWFNNYAKGTLGAIYGLDPLEAGERMTTQMQENYMRGIADLTFAGLEGYHEAYGFAKDYTRKEVLLWIAEASEEDAVRVFNTWLDFSRLREVIKTEGQKTTAEKKKNLGRGPRLRPRGTRAI